METNQDQIPSVKDLKEQNQKITQEVTEADRKKRVEIAQGVTDINQIRSDQVEMKVVQDQAQKNLVYYESLEKEGLLQDESVLARARELVQQITDNFDNGNEKAKNLMGIKEISEVVEGQAISIDNGKKETIKREEQKEQLMQMAKIWFVSFKQAVEDAMAVTKEKKEILEELDDSRHGLDEVIQKMAQEGSLIGTGFSASQEDLVKKIKDKRANSKLLEFKKKKGLDLLLDSEEFKKFEDSSKKWDSFEPKYKNIYQIVAENTDLLAEFSKIKTACENVPSLGMYGIRSEMLKDAKLSEEMESIFRYTLDEIERRS